MTITFPRALPDPFPWRDCKFLPSYQQVRAPTRGGLVQVANVAREFWTMKYQTAPLQEAKVAEFEAWHSTLRGGAKLFKAYHPLREYPLAYPGGFAGLTVAASPFTGSGVLTDVNGTLDQVTLGSLPVGFVLQPGDMLSFAYGSAHALHRVVEGATASGGGAAVVTVEPTVAIGWVDNADVLFERPWCTAVLDASSFDIAWQLGRKGVISFSAMQVH